jgi:hypothetical protein
MGSFSVAQTFPIRERLRTDFRRSIQRGSTGCVSGGLFGDTISDDRILSQTAGDQINSPRQMQRALKLYF